MAVSEAYPDLKANQNMMQLSEELTSTENKVAFARQAYNDAVMSYNNHREMFPASVVAGMFNFQPAQRSWISPSPKSARRRRSASPDRTGRAAADHKWISTPTRSGPGASRGPSWRCSRSPSAIIVIALDAVVFTVLAGRQATSYAGGSLDPLQFAIHNPAAALLVSRCSSSV